MPTSKNKSVEPGHRIMTGDGEGAGAEGESATAIDNLVLPDSIYQPNMAPLAADIPENSDEPAPPDGGVSAVNDAEGSGHDSDIPDENTGVIGDGEGAGAEGDGDGQQTTCMIVLKKGATYRFRGKTYFKDKPTPAEGDIAQKLLRSGMFVKG